MMFSRSLVFGVAAAKLQTHMSNSRRHTVGKWYPVVGMGIDPGFRRG